MLQTFLILASETAEPSKAPFYAAGGVLVAWAAALTTIGMRSETFPGEGRTFHGIIAVSAVLVAVTMFTAVVTA